MCPWCSSGPESVDDNPDPSDLCRPHLAEHQCVTLAELDRLFGEED